VERRGGGQTLRSIILYEIEITCTQHYIRGKPVPPRGGYTSQSRSKQLAPVIPQHTRGICDTE
jgi:hypothetical protein